MIEIELMWIKVIKYENQTSSCERERKDEGAGIATWVNAH